jgi:hypothetical protein
MNQKWRLSGLENAIMACHTKHKLTNLPTIFLEGNRFFQSRWAWNTQQGQLWPLGMPFDNGRDPFSIGQWWHRFAFIQIVLVSWLIAVVLCIIHQHLFSAIAFVVFGKAASLINSEWNDILRVRKCQLATPLRSKLQKVVMKRYVCRGRQPRGLCWDFVVGGRCIVDLRSAFILCCCSPAKCVHCISVETGSTKANFE